MRKSSAIRAAMRLRKWCLRRQGCAGCPFLGRYFGVCVIGTGTEPSGWPIMSFDDDCNMIATELQQEVESNASR